MHKDEAGGGSASRSAKAVFGALIKPGAAGTKRSADVDGAGSQRGTAECKKQCRVSEGAARETQLFSTEDSKARAALEWLQNQRG